MILMMYGNYKKARDAAWETLIKYNVTSLPVKIDEICEAEGLTVLPYSKAGPLIDQFGFGENKAQNDGFSTTIRASAGNLSCIFYDDIGCSAQRQRFIIGHEYGHFLCGHVEESQATKYNRPPSDTDPRMEKQANIVASRILTPACVIWALHIHDAASIARLCDITLEDAKWRLKRLNVLYKREKDFLAKGKESCFLRSPLERQVFEQFQGFIKAHL